MVVSESHPLWQWDWPFQHHEILDSIESFPLVAKVEGLFKTGLTCIGSISTEIIERGTLRHTFSKHFENSSFLTEKIKKISLPILS